MGDCGERVNYSISLLVELLADRTDKQETGMNLQTNRHGRGFLGRIKFGVRSVVVGQWVSKREADEIEGRFDVMRWKIKAILS